MVANRITLAGADDVREVVAWAMKHPGVEAFPVYNPIRLEVPDADGFDVIQGDLNGVTIQWDVHDELVLETEADEPNIVHPTAGSAVHVRVGGTVTLTKDGFEVENPELPGEIAQLGVSK